jgi:hypothetical protein
VIQIETTQEKAEKMTSLVNKSFQSGAFIKIEKDATSWRGAALDGDFFKELDDEKPSVIIVYNSHKISEKALLSYAHAMSADFYGSGNARKRAGNVGFVFLGHSLPTGNECKAIDLLAHDTDTLKWIHTFVTRITYRAKVC